MDRIKFTEQEKKILGRSGDFRVLRRYRESAIAVSLLFCLLFLGIGIASQSWIPLCVCAVLYALLTMAEKLAYAHALAGYKSIIVKLAKRLNEIKQK